MSKSKVTKSPVKGAQQTPTMIHNHIDNFLAKICGETPVDTEIRNSLEYWLNKIAEKVITELTSSTGNLTSVTIGGVTYNIPSATAGVPLYWHTVYFERGTPAEGEAQYSYLSGYMIIINQSPDPITISEWVNLIQQSGFYGVVLNGIMTTGASPIPPTTGVKPCVAIRYRSVTNTFNVVYRDDDYTLKDIPFSTSGFQTFADLGANRLN